MNSELFKCYHQINKFKNIEEHSIYDLPRYIENINALRNSLKTKFYEIINSNGNINHTNSKYIIRYIILLFFIQFLIIRYYSNNRTPDVQKIIRNIKNGDFFRVYKTNSNKKINNISRTVRSKNSKKDKNIYLKYTIFLSVIRNLFKNSISDVNVGKIGNIVAAYLFVFKYDMVAHSNNRINYYLGGLYFIKNYLSILTPICNALLQDIKNNTSSENELIQQFSTMTPFETLYDSIKYRSLINQSIYNDYQLQREILDRISYNLNSEENELATSILSLQEINSSLYVNIGYNIIKNIFKLYRTKYNDNGLIYADEYDSVSSRYRNNYNNIIYNNKHIEYKERLSAQYCYNYICNYYYMKYLRDVYLHGVQTNNLNLQKLCRNIYLISEYLITSSPLRLRDVAIEPVEMGMKSLFYTINDREFYTKREYYDRSSYISRNGFTYLLYNSELEASLETPIKNVLLNELTTPVIKNHIYLNQAPTINIQEIINRNCQEIYSFLERKNIINRYNENMERASQEFIRLKFLHPIHIMIGTYAIGRGSLPAQTVAPAAPVAPIIGSTIITKNVKNSLLAKYTNAKSLPNYNNPNNPNSYNTNSELNPTCSICQDRLIRKSNNSPNGLENGTGIIQLGCTHKFHIPCIVTWGRNYRAQWRRDPRCPLCNTTFTMTGGKKRKSKKVVKKRKSKKVVKKTKRKSKKSC
jgi:hypothetical protein